MKKTLKWLVVALFTFFVGAQFVRPERSNVALPAEQSFNAHLNVPSDVNTVLNRACMDCHSNQTSWPWYSNVAPVSWFVADHVNHGRSHLNFSTWASYERDDAEQLLDSICREVKNGKMPLKSYIYLHPDAELSVADRKKLCDWSMQESNRLASTEARGGKRP